MQKRNLTPTEIKSICNQITGFKDLPTAIGNSVKSNMKKQIREQLQNIQVYPSIIPSIIKEVRKQYREIACQQHPDKGAAGEKMKR